MRELFYAITTVLLIFIVIVWNSCTLKNLQDHGVILRDFEKTIEECNKDLNTDQVCIIILTSEIRKRGNEYQIFYR